MDKLYSSVRGRITERFGSQGEFAKVLNLSEQTISAKLTGRSQFSQDDIIEWCRLLDIDLSEVGSYFFVPSNFQNGKEN